MMKKRMMNRQHRLDATLRELTRLKLGGRQRERIPLPRSKVPFTE